MHTKVIGTASGISKKDAEQNAARMALLYLVKPAPVAEVLPDVTLDPGPTP